MGFKFNVGDRVDYAPWEPLNGTPGTIVDSMRLRDGVWYIIEWDDGFTEESDVLMANLWPESDLVPLDTAPGDGVE